MDFGSDIATRDETLTERPGPSPEEMMSNARDAAAFLKALAHEGRLMILCHLASGEKSVGELEALLDSRQAAVSQQLARLRREGMVAARREGKVIHYSLHDPKVRRTIETVHALFCQDPDVTHE